MEAEFSHTWLPSHDHTHHRRVWLFAKELVRALCTEGCHFSESKLEQLIIAVFFHDTGLTQTLDASHGRESREICRKFLNGFSAFSTDSAETILAAVEKHDDKTYAESFPPGKELPDDILTMLAVCDDLDAFGATGVFRYLEIYVQRGVPLRMMPEKVLENLEKRFHFLVQNFNMLGNFIQVHKKRYHYTADFYRKMGLQFASDPGRTVDTGPVKVVGLLTEKILHERIPVAEIGSHIQVSELDEFSYHYFSRLEKEHKGSLQGEWQP